MIRKLIIFAATFFALPALAQIAVIVHPSNNSNLTNDELVRIYTGRSNAFNAVNLAESVPLRAQFDEKGVGRTSAQLKAHWSKLVFTGKGTPPTELASEQEVLNFVASNPQAIGYISTTSVSDAVKVALTIN
jgi:ABC-type phosphate transport system substrate-binding protein